MEYWVLVTGQCRGTPAPVCFSPEPLGAGSVLAQPVNQQCREPCSTEKPSWASPAAHLSAGSTRKGRDSQKRWAAFGGLRLCLHVDPAEQGKFELSCVENLSKPSIWKIFRPRSTHCCRSGTGSRFQFPWKWWQGNVKAWPKAQHLHQGSSQPGWRLFGNHAGSGLCF